MFLLEQLAQDEDQAAGDDRQAGTNMFYDGFVELNAVPSDTNSYFDSFSEFSSRTLHVLATPPRSQGMNESIDSRELT